MKHFANNLETVTNFEPFFEAHFCALGLVLAYSGALLQISLHDDLQNLSTISKMLLSTTKHDSPFVKMKKTSVVFVATPFV